MITRKDSVLPQQIMIEIYLLTSHKGPLWCHGRWRQFIDDQEHWDNTLNYVEAHNERRGLAVGNALPLLRRT